MSMSSVAYYKVVRNDLTGGNKEKLIQMYFLNWKKITVINVIWPSIRRYRVFEEVIIKAGKQT